MILSIPVIARSRATWQSRDYAEEALYNDWRNYGTGIAADEYILAMTVREGWFGLLFYLYRDKLYYLLKIISSILVMASDRKERGNPGTMQKKRYTTFL